MKRLIVLGAGGFGRTVADVARQSGRYATVVHLDDRPGEGVIGNLKSFAEYIGEGTEFFVAFGNNALRLEWLRKLWKASGVIATLVHPTAYISPVAEIGEGSIVLPMAVVNTATVVGLGCIVNCGALIDHGSVVEDGCHICLGAIVKAENRITSCTKIEAGCVVEARTYPV